jgi:hypothetical protein
MGMIGFTIQNFMTSKNSMNTDTPCTGAIISAEVTQRLAHLICNALSLQPPLLAISLFFETCQPEPALYLCYETVE